MGSIGQRHLRNLKKLKEKYKYFTVRKKNVSPELSIDNKIINKKFFSNKNDIKEILEKDSKDKKFHTVFICNPSSMHLKSSLIYAKNTNNLFIEKPLSNNMKHIEKLRKILKLKKVNCAVGYQLRYHPFLKKIKDFINSNKLGKIKEAYLRNSHYLPYHHLYLIIGINSIILIKIPNCHHFLKILMN